MTGFFSCLGLIIVAAPIVLLIVGARHLRSIRAIVDDLRRRIVELESRAGIQTTAKVAAPPPLPRPASPPLPTARGMGFQPMSHRQDADATPINWESILGVKLFAWIGGLAFFLGVIFFLKYAFENNLITPAMRIVSGAIIGTLLVLIGSLSATQRYRVPAQSLLATGVLILYADVYAAHAFYHLIPLGAAFAIMSAITLVALWHASRLHAQSIVWLAIFGGFLTPALLWTPRDNPVALFGYIVVLNFAVATIALVKRWDYFIVLAALGTIATECGWLANFFGPATTSSARNILLGLEGQFLAVAIYRARLQPLETWTVMATALLGWVAIAFCLDQEKFGGEFTFPILFFANAGLLALASVRSTFPVEAAVSAAIPQLPQPTPLPLQKNGAIAFVVAVGLALTWLAERIGHDTAFASAEPIIALVGYCAIFLLFAAAPHFAGPDRRWPWVISAVAGPLQFWFVYRLIAARWPNEAMFLCPIAFALPAVANIAYLVQRKKIALASGDARLAAQAGAFLFFISLIFPVQFEHEWITLGWALEGVALIALFHWLPNRSLRGVALVVLCAAFARLALNPAVLEYHRRSATPIWNWYLYAYGIGAICFFLAGRWFGAPRNALYERIAPSLLASLAVIMVFLLMNIEIADYFSIGPTLTFSFTGNFARDMTYTIAWAVFALTLLIIGIAQKVRAARLASIGLLGFALAKLFLHDLDQLNQLYRIAAFLSVAAIAIIASFAYQRFLVPPKSPNAS